MDLMDHVIVAERESPTLVTIPSYVFRTFDDVCTALELRAPDVLAALGAAPSGSGHLERISSALSTFAVQSGTSAGWLEELRVLPVATGVVAPVTELVALLAPDRPGSSTAVARALDEIGSLLEAAIPPVRST